MRFMTSICGLLMVIASGTSAGEVQLTVTEPSDVRRANWPVTSGIPLSAGELWDHRDSALYAGDEEVPLQTEVLSRWADGSIRWLLLDFQVTLAAGESRELELQYGDDVQRSRLHLPQLISTGPTREREVAPGAMTGPLRIDLSPDEFRLLDRIWLDHDGDGEFSDVERLTSSESAGLVVVTPDGTQHRADLALATWTIEQHGPLRGCVRLTGRHRSEDGKELFPYVVRLHFYRGQPFFKCEFTFVNDIQDALMGQIDSLELVCSSSDGSASQLVLNEPVTLEPARLMQVNDQEFQIEGKRAGRRAPGWASIGSDQGGLPVGVHQFWQNWPKSLQVQPGQLRVGICPAFEKGLYDDHDLLEEAKLYSYLRDGVYTFKIGMARTHQLWVHAYTGAPDVSALHNFYTATEMPLLAQCSPEHVCATGVVGDAPPAAPERYHGYDAWLDLGFQRHLEDQEAVREYGMLNFGDWWDGKKCGGGWGNQEFDTSHIFFTQYLRSGDRRYFDRARQGAAHLMDVDVLHAISPHIRGLDHHGDPQPGSMWTHGVGHTGGDYDHAPLDASWWYQLGMLQNAGHVWVGGLCDWYCLSGNRRAYDVARLVADRVALQCPTGYGDHIRVIGWPLNLVVTAYEMTGDDKYLDAADRQWELLREHFDPEQGWKVMLAYGHCLQKSKAERCRGQCSYMLALTLSALAKYHKITEDPEVLEALSVGLDQMISESWHDGAKSFYATACIHTRSKPLAAYNATITLSALA